MGTKLRLEIRSLRLELEKQKTLQAEAEAWKADAEAGRLMLNREADAEAWKADAEAWKADAEARKADAEAWKADAEARKADADARKAEAEARKAEAEADAPRHRRWIESRSRQFEFMSRLPERISKDFRLLDQGHMFVRPLTCCLCTLAPSTQSHNLIHPAASIPRRPSRLASGARSPGYVL
jgi:hypothetical protein